MIGFKADLKNLFQKWEAFKTKINQNMGEIKSQIKALEEHGQVVTNMKTDMKTQDKAIEDLKNQITQQAQVAKQQA